MENENFDSINSSAMNSKRPDQAVNFGYKCMWFAIKTTDKASVAEALKLNTVDCNWETGINEAYKGAIFITPAIKGWILACGWGLPHGDSIESIAIVKEKLKILSAVFGEAQFFCTQRISEYHCWILARRGQVERVYSFLGERGENILIEGAPTVCEKKLNLVNTFSEESKHENYFEQEDLTWPDEDLVMQIAEHWSINPSKLEDRTDISYELGLLGSSK